MRLNQLFKTRRQVDENRLCVWIRKRRLGYIQEQLRSYQTVPVIYSLRHAFEIRKTD